MGEDSPIAARPDSPGEEPSGEEPNDTLLIRATQHRRYSGPLPPPELIAGYEAIAPGMAKKIFAMLEAESKHRQECESKELDANIQLAQGEQASERRGQIFGLVVAMVLILCSTTCILNGYTTGGSILGGGTLIGLVTVFIVGRASTAVPSVGPPADQSEGQRRTTEDR